MHYTGKNKLQKAFSKKEKFKRPPLRKDKIQKVCLGEKGFKMHSTGKNKLQKGLPQEKKIKMPPLRKNKIQKAFLGEK